MNLHIATTLPGNKIFCGSMQKDGRTWCANKQDLTNDALIAVAEYVVNIGKPVIIYKQDASAQYEITVVKKRQENNDDGNNTNSEGFMSFDEWWEDYSRHFYKSIALHTTKEYARLGWDAALKNQWQPIEKCPIDTPVLCVENGKTFRSVFVFDGKHWYDSDGYIVDDFKPTHFMLIPETPK